jgi:putative transposase
VIDSYVKLPKLGLVKCALSQEVKGRILSATVSQTPTGKYFASLNCRNVPIDKFLETDRTIGIDMGLKTQYQLFQHDKNSGYQIGHPLAYQL